MQSGEMSAKAELLELIERLSDDEASEVLSYLGRLACGGVDEPAFTFEDAPLDNEPETEEERVAVAEARAALVRGEVIDHATFRRELGL